MDGLKNKTLSKLSEYDHQITHEKGVKGSITGRQANINLKRRLRDKEEEFEKNIDELILQTSKTSALRAVNLNELLKKKWSEEKNAYRMMSNIKTDKEDRRIKYILKKHAF